MKLSSLLVAGLCTLLSLSVVSAPAFAKEGKNAGQKTAKKTVKKFTGTPGQYPESSDRLLTEKDMEHMTPWGLKVMANEIYARHGYAFKETSLKQHFRKEKWYKGKEWSMKKIKLTDVEKQNLEFIRRHQPKARV